MLTPKPNINQLPGNREKDKKKKRHRREEEGHQSMVDILRDAGAEKVCVLGFFCMCMWVCVAGLVEHTLHQPAHTHERGGHAERAASTQTHTPVSFSTLPSVCLQLGFIWPMRRSGLAAAGYHRLSDLKQAFSSRSEHYFLLETRV